MIMKKILTMVLTVVAATTMLLVTSCSKSDNLVGTSGGLADQNLVGVWWLTSATGGSQVLADGTMLPLTAYGGKIAVDTAAAKLSTVKITASNGTGTYSETSKSSFTGKDTTASHQFTYVLSNSNNNLSVAQIGDTSAYTRKNIGDAAVGGGTTSNTLSITLDGTAYTMTAHVTANHDTLDIIGVTAGGQGCEIKVMNQVATQSVGTSIPMILFITGSTEYFSTSGSITITSISGLNTQGTFSVSMINPASPTVFKSASGSFNVTQ